MATLALDMPAEQTGTELTVAVQANPGIVLLDTEKFDVWYENLKASAPTDADVTTRKGQEALRSFAAKVRSEKAAIDKARLRLTKEWRDMTAQANEAGKTIGERLERLAVEVRKPLTDWEEAEKARIAECEATIERIITAGTVTLDDTAASVRERGAAIWQAEIDAERFGALFDRATTAKDHTVSLLKTALARLTQEEADRAELEKLRAAAAEREAREQAEREAREAEEIAAAEAKAQEERRVAAEKAEAERIQRVEREAAERAQREAEAAARAEQERRDREHAEALAAERRRAEQAERDAQAERDRIAAAEAARQKEADRLAAEQAKRDADQKHRTKVKTAAKEALITCGADDETARKIVIAIIAGEIPNVSLRF
ncbi:hypothetical protein SAMN05428950_1011310 [Sphingomonas sp. OV641]|nr:hypothetical protein SAMN05428950_1011310 [Sphingomonas sp. OV641]